MLREAMTQINWCDKTMSMMREKQFEACERRLWAHHGASLFSPAATDMDAQWLVDNSYYREELPQQLYTLEMLRDMVLAQLPMECLYLSQGERELLERLLLADGSLALTEWDDIGAAEALLRRLWCSLHMAGNAWTLELPRPLHEPLLLVMKTQQYAEAKELLFRYDAMIQGLLYIMGYLHGAQPIASLCTDVMHQSGEMAVRIARRYVKSAYEYITGCDGELILLHPGLAEPHCVLDSASQGQAFSMALSQPMIAGGMNGILPEEQVPHEAMGRALMGALRPEYDAAEAAEDLRMLAKQGVSLLEMEAVMASMLCTFPTAVMKQALSGLRQSTPRWPYIQAGLVQ